MNFRLKSKPLKDKTDCRISTIFRLTFIIFINTWCNLISVPCKMEITQFRLAVVEGLGCFSTFSFWLTNYNYLIVKACLNISFVHFLDFNFLKGLFVWKTDLCLIRFFYINQYVPACSHIFVRTQYCINTYVDFM